MNKNFINKKNKYKKYGLLTIALIVAFFAFYHVDIQTVKEYKTQQQDIVNENLLVNSQNTSDQVHSTDGVSNQLVDSGLANGIEGSDNNNSSTVMAESNNTLDNNQKNNTIYNTNNTNEDNNLGNENTSQNSSSFAGNDSNIIGNKTTENTEPNENNTITCTIEVRCDALSNNLNKWTNSNSDPGKIVPQNGTILNKITVTVKEGSSAYDALKYAAQLNSISIQVKSTIYGIYVVGIQHINEKDAGSLSGWIYKVNGNTVSYGISEYNVVNGDEIKLLYTCNMGLDLQ